MRKKLELNYTYPTILSWILTIISHLLKALKQGFQILQLTLLQFIHYPNSNKYEFI